jgi:hypothetical protein
MLAMYFCNAIEQAIQLTQQQKDWKRRYSTEPASATTTSRMVFPPPLTEPPPNDAAVTNLLYGHQQHDSDSNKSQEYRMHHVSCRTNFLPALDSDKILPSIVVSGLSPSLPGGDLDNILTERTDAHYRSGWVMDVSSIERDTKLKVDACGGLGYVDMKIALYGIPESGTLRFWLPVQPEQKSSSSTLASDYLHELVICEANEKRPDKACHLDHDLTYTVGGVKVGQTTMIKGAAEYLKRSTCVHVGIPAKAQVTSLDQVKDSKGNPLTTDVQRRLAGSHPSAEKHLVGLVVDIQVTGAVTRKDGACCISHIVWEHSS